MPTAQLDFRTWTTMMQANKTTVTVPIVIRLDFPSCEHEVRVALASLKEGLAPSGLTREDTGTVELVLGEVLNNVVEHAYGPYADGTIHLKCRVVDGDLAFCVCDAGRAMPGLNLPEGKPPNVDVAQDELPEGGFGWFLVRSLARRLKYARRREFNVFCFDIPLGQVAAEAADCAPIGADCRGG